jgi:hypothetical protein
MFPIRPIRACAGSRSICVQRELTRAMGRQQVVRRCKPGSLPIGSLSWERCWFQRQISTGTVLSATTSAA